MDCQQTQSHLSEYYDGELPDALRSAVAEHIGSCAGCRAELSVFDRLSSMSRGLADPEPPQGIWAGIESALDADRTSAPMGRSAARSGRTARKWRPGLRVTAAIVLIVTGVVWFATSRRFLDRHRELAADLEQYVEHFTSNPETAQEVLLAKYGGHAVDAAEATRQLGYRPAVATGLPQGYSLESMYVLDLPCCKCLQTVCRRDDGKVVAIFEHDEEQPAWFGDGPRIDTQCTGHPCRVIEADQGVVASWKANKRQLTVVGAGNLEEIADLITHFQTSTPEA